MATMKLKKGDQVQVMAGKQKGTRGAVLRTFPDKAMILVEAVNIVKRHRKPRTQGDPGGIVDLHKPIHASNAMLICPSTDKPSRIGYRTEDGKRVRFAKKSGATL